MEMTKKQGRPKNRQRRIKAGYWYKEATMDALGELAEAYGAEAPPYLEVSQRMIIEALIHYAKKLHDAGELPYAVLFEASSEAAPKAN